MLLADAALRLRLAGFPSAEAEARVLAGHALGLDRLGILLHGDAPAPAERRAAFEAALRRRLAGEPLAHVTGTREFYGREFLVTPDTLIPRPETEDLVDDAIRLLPERAVFADLGAGSGCLGVSVILERPDVRGIAADISQAILRVARENARRLGAADRLRCILGDIFRLPLRPGSLDAILANPPYIAPEEALDVMPEVRRHEPHAALFSPEGGLAHLRAVAAGALSALRPGGRIIMEHGGGQGAAVRGMLRADGFEDVATLRDPAGLERRTQARKPA